MPCLFLLDYFRSLPLFFGVFWFRGFCLAVIMSSSANSVDDSSPPPESSRPELTPAVDDGGSRSVPATASTSPDPPLATSSSKTSYFMTLVTSLWGWSSQAMSYLSRLLTSDGWLFSSGPVPEETLKTTGTKFHRYRGRSINLFMPPVDVEVAIPMEGLDSKTSIADLAVDLKSSAPVLDAQPIVPLADSSAGPSDVEV
jgi:hypothetical protein